MHMDGRRMNRKNRKINYILSLIYPPRCPFCDDLIETWNDGFFGYHKACKEILQTINEPICYHCGKALETNVKELCYDCAKRAAGGISYIESGRGIYEYKDKTKLMMYRFKYGNRGCYAACFAKEAVNRHSIWLGNVNPDVIIPVTMTGRKKCMRGYNQAEEFAKALGQELQIPVDCKSVKRCRNTKALKTMDPAERKNNLKNAFHVEDSIVSYRKILLVDDIYTTGATVETIAEAIRRQADIDVYFLVVCVGSGY